MDAFIQKWLGRRIDQDGAFGFQCVDLIKQYALEVFGFKPGAWGNAIDYWTNTNHPLLTKFSRISSQSPQKGDIVILNPTSTNRFGHIAIAVDASTMLEQNGATGDGDGAGRDEVRLRTIPKARIAGILRPKVTNQGEPPMTPEQERQAYQIVLNRSPEGAPSGRTGWQFIIGAKAELDAQRAHNAKVVADLQSALEAEKNKPAKEVTKTVEKIVEKPVEVIREVEVVKTVEVEPSWLKRVREAINSFLNKKG